MGSQHQTDDGSKVSPIPGEDQPCKHEVQPGYDGQRRDVAHLIAPEHECDGELPEEQRSQGEGARHGEPKTQEQAQSQERLRRGQEELGSVKNLGQVACMSRADRPG